MLLIKLHATNPIAQIAQKKQLILHLEDQLCQQIRHCLQQQKSNFDTVLATLHVISPLATLSRGYAIATSQHHVLMNSQQVKCGDIINVQLAKGHLTCEVLNHAE